MSTGSTNIVVQITDQVDGTIAPKIREIGAAAREANTYLVALQSGVSILSGGSSKLSDALKQLRSPIDDAGASSNRLTGALAQLTARVAGAEAGLGMIGGAFGRVGVAAGLAGPLIVAALAVAAVGGAVLAYEKMQDAALKVTEAQTVVASTTNGLNDALLKQSENLIGLTRGPLAKYRQELLDLPFKSIKVDLADLQKEWKDEDSFWVNGLNKIEAFAEKVSSLSSSPGFFGQGLNTPQASQPIPQTFGISDAQKFVADQEKIREQGTQTKTILAQDEAAIASDAKNYADERTKNNLSALQNDLVNTRNAIAEKQALLRTESGSTATLTQQGIDVLKEYYQRDLIAYQSYLGEKKTLSAGANGELLSEQKRAAAEQLKAFNDELSQLKNAEGVVTPQVTLQLRQQQLSGAERPTQTPGLDSQPALALNKDTLDKDIGNAQQAIDRQNRSLDQLIIKYRDETLASGSYSVALKTEVEQRKAAAEVNKIAPGNTNDITTIATLNKLIAARERDAEVSKEESAIYNEFEGPILKYNAALEASIKLLADGAITSSQAAIADNAALRAKQDSLNPLNEFVIGLEHEIGLLGTYGQALTAAIEVDKIRQDLQKSGRDLTTSEASALNDFLTKLQQQKILQQDINTLYTNSIEATQKLAIQQLALNTAFEKGFISENQYGIATAQVNVQLANQALAEGKAATIQDQLIAGIGKYIAGYQGVAKGLSDTYGQVFTTIANGAADSLGKAIAYGQNLGRALENVARSAVSELISGMIKLGIQFLVNQAISQSAGATAVATSLGQAAAISSAWAPAAAFASLASFGANAAPADAAIAGTVALTQGLALIAGHSAGGYIDGPGTGTSDSILGRLSRGEYVVNAAATAANRDFLEAINSGASVLKSNSGSSVTSSGPSGSQMRVSVTHDGSTAIRVQQIGENEVRIIARQEAGVVVADQAPKVISSEIQNPNSRTSKALSQQLVVNRRR